MKLLPTLSALLGTCAATSLHLSISPSSSLLDLSNLPSSTHATLYGPSGKRATAPLRIDNSFIFPNLEEGEWLLDVHSRDYVFPSLRVDVVDPVSILPIKQEGDGEAAPVASTPETVTVYLTHPSNRWGHLGAKIAASTAALSSAEQVKLSVSALGKKTFYEQRQGFDLLSFFKNPMILMGVLSMGLVFGMPYLMENMDEETKAEFAEIQKQGPLGMATGAAGGPGQNTAQQIQNFDLAGWMAGKK
ncbi:unnamed protein product [Aureobasidium vineae]|uniref:ER membrane protein complex subunit 7 beta-sandwich domain-containing protein n=1 Tax=Aureobasidium vineae TaxID=2773715 RepID=A0A9N8JRQ8_9PEZI|nr:unnamed protein product [Aureobasidium vineae]